MISRLLIANRGEIARRIIRTCRRMGVETVAVYSEADASSAYVREADQAVAIGPPPSAESYLRIDRILDAARASGADAIHPGYGFLSENADFAQAVIGARLVWVGPPPGAIRAMALKDEAKRRMAAIGVPVTPGYLGEDQSEARLKAEADRIGYPVLIKAVAGGGGRGMRRVDEPGAFRDALAACRREALASFGDERVLIETYAQRPRHIEVQVFADSHGNAVHLYERDCSLQRRRQKVIEEAPAPGMTAAVREAVTSAALRAAQGVGYQGAGTVEFIADASDGLRADRIWFMEMNTRLQVEHPVTEAVTGLDLVEWQLRVAAGEPLPLRQDEITLNGHAIEARLYAEDPAKGFLPSTGRLDHLRLPTGVRVDSAVEEGDPVTPYYDAMIAKLVAHASAREAAVRRLAEACGRVEAWPVKTNAAFLARCLDDPDFQAGAVDTGFIEARLETLAADRPPSDAAFAAAARARVAAERDPADPWRALAGFRLNAAPEVSAVVQAGADARRVELKAAGSLPTFATPDTVVVFEHGAAFAFSEPQAGAAAEAAADGAVVSPMPGRVVAVPVATGDTVATGQPLVTVEAMKMEHVLTAPFDGVVAELWASVGDQAPDGAVLVRLERA